jgi:hypothetical protein
MSLGTTKLTAAANEIATAQAQLEMAFGALDEMPIDGRAGLDREKPLVGIDVPISLVELRLATIYKLLVELPRDIPLGNVALSQLTEIQTNSSQIRRKADELVALLESIRSHGGLQPTDWATLEIANPDTTLSLKLVPSVIQPIIGWTDAILIACNQLLPILAPDRLDFSYAVENATKAERRARETQAQITIAAATASSEAAAAAESNTRAELSAARVAEHEVAAKKIRDDLAIIEGDTRSKKAGADEAIAAATALKLQVDQYAPQFEAFQHALDERNNRWSTTQTELERLKAELQQQGGLIKDTIDRANRMLATATNAGLTAAQENRFQELTSELSSAGWGVNFSYLLLFCSLFPLLLYVIGNWDKTIMFTGGLEYAANVMLRAFLLLPALLFVGFTTHRYRRLFRLKHEYGFRASLAGAVEGFKAQAPTHGEDIAAVAFYQLGRNPADGIDGIAKTPPWYEKLLEIIQRFGDRFGKT